MGDTWILLRGLTREAGHWGEFVPALASALPGADVHTLDLPGAGVRNAETWPASVVDAMEMVRAEAARRRRDGARTFVLGVSLGGMLTMEWAARHPGELAGIVVGASSASDCAPPWKRMRPAALLAVLAANLNRDVARREAAILRVISNRRDRHAELAAAWTEIQRLRPVSRATTRRQLLSASRWRAPARLAVPALFLVGEGDQLVHPDCSRSLAGRFAAPLIAHPSAGHDLTSDDGPWVASEIARWRAAL